MIAETSLEIRGHHGLPVANTFLRQQVETSHLSIFLPGYAYTNQMPVLYYLHRLLVERGADVLLLEYEYNRTSDYLSLPVNDQMRWVYADAGAATQAGLAQRSYQRVTLVGKSLGTLAMGYLVERLTNLPAPECVWLTPILSAESLRVQILRSRPRSLFVIGTRDHYYQPERLAELEEATGGSSLVIQGGDHALDVDSSTLKSIEALRQVVSQVAEFTGKESTHS